MKEVMVHRKLLPVMVVMALLALAATAFALPNPLMQLTDYSMTPSTASPGAQVGLDLHMANVDPSHCADSVKVSILVSYPLSVQGNDSRYLGTACNGDTNNLVKFSLAVDSLAATGTYPVTVNTAYGLDYAKYSETDTIYVRVIALPLLTASIVSSTPRDIYPGNTADLTISIQNSGSGRVQSAHLSLVSPDGLEVKWAGSSQELGEIAPHSVTNIHLSVKAPKGLEPADRHLMGTLDYADDTNSPKRQFLSFVVPVKPKPDFVVTPQVSGPLLNSDSTAVRLVLKNTGSSDAHKVKAQIKPVFPFSSDGTVRYLESLPAGQETELDYEITVDSTATPGSQLLSLNVDFENPEQDKFSDTFDFSLPVRPKNIIDVVIQNIFLLAVFAVIIVVIIQRRQKKK